MPLIHRIVVLLHSKTARTGCASAIRVNSISFGLHRPRNRRGNRRDGSPDHFQDRQSKMEMQTKQVTNHNKDNGLLNMIKRTAPMIL